MFESFLVRASDTGIYWALSVAITLLPEDMRDPRKILAFMLPRMDATFRAVTSPTDELRFDELVDRDRSRSGEPVVRINSRAGTDVRA